eukprot:TRINITY_DN52221_c0_g1_i1.p1 TRINITY_DN52221_c0_g1~~TRINITY_DN52221_c0_g1_i1.p1  ORF type:complete len:676 (+),score=155.32 TRINITY_DN52221_c0_g1_i1:141-2168(+)
MVHMFASGSPRPCHARQLTRNPFLALAVLSALWWAPALDRLAFSGANVWPRSSRPEKVSREACSSLGSWAEEKRLVASEGGAPRRGPHAPKPLEFIFAGREAGPGGRAAPAAAGREETDGEEAKDAGTELALSADRPGALEEAGSLNPLRELALASLDDAEQQELAAPSVRELVRIAAAEAQRGGLQAEDLSSSLRAIATFRRRSPELKAQLPAILDSLLGRGLELQATGTTDALWAVAELKSDAPLLRALLPVLVVRLARTAPQLSIEESVTSLWSAAALRKELQDSKIKIAPLAAYISKKIAEDGVKGLSMQFLADLLWSLAMVRTLPKETFEVTTQLLVKEILSRPLSEVSVYNTYSMLYSVAMLQDTSVHAEVQRLLPSLREAMKTAAEHMTPDQIASCLWSLGVAEPNSSESRGLLDEIRTEVGTAVSELKMKELSIALWGLASLRYKDKEILDMTADRYIANEPRLKSPFLAKMIARIAWAYGELGYSNTKWILAVEDRLRPEKHVIRFLGPDQLHALCWALDKLHPDRQESVTKNLKAKLMKYIKMRYTHGLREVTDKFGDSRIHKYRKGYIEPYIEIDPSIKKENRNGAMLEAAVELGKDGPDAPILRRTSSGRVKVSSKRWVKDGSRFYKALGSVYEAKQLEDAQQKKSRAAIGSKPSDKQAQLPE